MIWRIAIVLSAMGWALALGAHPAVAGFFVVTWAGSTIRLYRIGRR